MAEHFRHMAIGLTTNTKDIYLVYREGNIAELCKNLATMIQRIEYEDMPLQTYDTRSKVSRELTVEETEKIKKKINDDLRNLSGCNNR